MSFGAAETSFCWHILGLGSIGGSLAAFCLRNNQKLTVILKNEQGLKQLISNQGLEFTKAAETERFSLSQLNPQLPHTVKKPITHLLLTVKAYDVLPALASIAHCFTTETQIYCFQNGLGTIEQIQALYPQCRLYSVVASMGVYQLGPYRIKEGGKGHFWVGKANKVPCLSFSDLPFSFAEKNVTKHATVISSEEEEVVRPTALLNLLQQGDLSCTWVDDIRSAQWQKLAVNCAINPLTVLYQCTNGALLENVNIKSTLMRLVGEVAQVMNVLGIVGAEKETLQQLAIEVAQKTANNRSSMLQDHEKGKVTEIDYLNGYIVALANSLGIAVPENERMTKAIKALAKDCITKQQPYSLG